MNTNITMNTTTESLVAEFLQLTTQNFSNTYRKGEILIELSARPDSTLRTICEEVGIKKSQANDLMNMVKFGTQEEVAKVGVRNVRWLSAKSRSSEKEEIQQMLAESPVVSSEAIQARVLEMKDAARTAKEVASKKASPVTYTTEQVAEIIAEKNEMIRSLQAEKERLEQELKQMKAMNPRTAMSVDEAANPVADDDDNDDSAPTDEEVEAMIASTYDELRDEFECEEYEDDEPIIVTKELHDHALKLRSFGMKPDMEFQFHGETYTVREVMEAYKMQQSTNPVEEGLDSVSAKLDRGDTSAARKRVLEQMNYMYSKPMETDNEAFGSEY